MKATQLGTVVFEYPQEVLEACSVMEERVKSAAGTDKVYMAKDYTPNITLSSAEDDWLSLQNITDISVMCEEMRETPITLYYEDGSTKEVLFNHTQPPSFTEIAPGVCFYYGTINLTVF